MKNALFATFLTTTLLFVGCTEPPVITIQEPGDPTARRPFPQAGWNQQMRPTTVSQDQLNRDIIRLYRDLRDRSLRTSTNGKHSYFAAGGTGVNGSRALTNSETHGYGMLILVLMAGANGDERAIFDRMNALRKVQGSTTPSRTEGSRNNLMSWVIHDAESSNPVPEVRSCWQEEERCWTVGTCVNGSGRPATFGRSNSATDGDMDMAYALILAHRQWNDQRYLDDAREIIASIKELNFHLNNPDHPNESIAQYRTNLGDWHGRWNSNTLASRTTSRTSDWMPGHFRAFHAATGDNFWLSAADEVYSLLRQVSHTGTGLMPDFIIDVPARVVASAAEAVVAGEHNWYNYAFNACRVPWRLALDFVHNGNADARTQINTISNWLRGATNANPGEIAQGYNVDGTVVTSGFAMAFTAPFAAGMLGDTRNQTFLNATYSALASRQGSSFYNDALRLLSLLLVTGNWWAP